MQSWGSESPSLHHTKKSNPSCRSLLSELRMHVLHDGSCPLIARSSACNADKCQDWKENRDTGEWFANEHGAAQGWSTALRMGSRLDQGGQCWSLGSCPTGSCMPVYKEGGGQKSRQLLNVGGVAFTLLLGVHFPELLGTLTSDPVVYIMLCCLML